jgi:cytochrome oxidase assembly protein ShyY1
MNRRFRFAPGLRLTLFAALFLPILIGLGAWQWQRAEEKKELEATIEARLDRPPRPLDLASDSTPPDLARVRIEGRILADRQVLRDNRTHEGRVGYEVHAPVVPVLTTPGEPPPAVLVNFGWVEAPPTRDELPQVQLPTTPVILTGIVDAAGEQGPTFGEVAETGRWPLRVQQIELDRLREPLGVRLRDATVVADATSPGAQVYNWEPVRMGSGTHRGYAFQWWGLALVLAAGWLFASLERKPPPAADGTGRNR